MAAITALLLLGSLVSFLFSVVLIGIGASGHPGVYIEPAAMFRLGTLVIPPLGLSVVSVIAVIGIFMRSRLGWYLSLLLWFSSITYLVYAMLVLLPISAPSADAEYASFAAVILLNIVFIVYFQRENVKKYFKVGNMASASA
jgi:hypothetical protein